MTKKDSESIISIEVNVDTLYRETTITDDGQCIIKELIPILDNNDRDYTRVIKYVGMTFIHLSSSDMSIPIHVTYNAENLKEALEIYSAKINAKIAEMVDTAKKRVKDMEDNPETMKEFDDLFKKHNPTIH